MTKKSSKSKGAAQPSIPEEPKRTTSQMSSTAKTKERIEERKREHQRSQQRLIAIVLVVVAVLAVLLVLARTVPTEAPVDAGLDDTYAGIDQGVNEQGFARLGKADAPTRIVEYASFGCPGCRTFHELVLPQLLPYLKSGQANFTYFVQFTGEGNVEGAARTAICAGQQDQFWEMHDVLFDWQSRFGANAFSDNRLRAGVSGLGLNSDAFFACFNGESTNNLIALAKQQGVQSTPTILIDGVPVSNPLAFDEIGAALGAVNPIVEEPAATQEASATTEPTAEATTEAVATEESPATEEAAATDEAEATAEATEAGD